ncbi:MAG: LLM class flavin-dependent oxidoreductase [Acidimicrobiales bacterium]
MLRFGLSAPGFDDHQQLVARARWAERVGFSTFSLSDHLNGCSPFVTLAAVAAATTTIRVGTLVLNNDLRQVAVLAQDAATLDRLSDGRLELGLGAGWALAEYRRAGIAYDRPVERIERLREHAGAAAVVQWRAGPHTLPAATCGSTGTSSCLDRSR